MTTPEQFTDNIVTVIAQYRAHDANHWQVPSMEPLKVCTGAYDDMAFDMMTRLMKTCPDIRIVKGDVGCFSIYWRKPPVSNDGNVEKK